MNYTDLASAPSLEKTKSALKEKGYDVITVENGADALAKIKELIPSGASVMNGSSVTLEQIGYKEYLESGKHPWVDLHAKVTAEDDKEKRAKLRKESVLSDYYLGSVHAMTEDGQIVIASNTGSQLPHVVFTSPNLIFVVSTKKIVPDLAEAFKRLEEHVVPLEDKHMLGLYNVHTALNKVLIFKGEAAMIQRKIHILFVKEDLGF